MYKKLNISFLVLLISIAAAVNFSPVKAAQSDISDQGKEAWEFLTGVGVFDTNEGYKPDSPISRAEFTRLIIKLRGYKDMAENNTDIIFSDVDALSKDRGYISTAYALGYVKGYSDGTFCPDNAITGSEALKLTLEIIDYGAYSDAAGGYTDGYLYTAEQMKLLDGTGVRMNESVTWDSAMLLLANAAETDLLKIKSYGTKVELQTVPGENLLSEKFSIYKTEAIIEANEYTDIMAADGGVKKGCVLAAGQLYETGDTHAEEYLGMNMKMYYVDDDRVFAPKLLYIKPYKNKNSVLELNGDDISALSQNGTAVEYRTEKGGKRRLNLSDKASLIYNGKLTLLDEAKLTPEIGTVKLISNDGDEIYDVIIVMSYESYVVSAVSEDTWTVSTKQGKKLILNEDECKIVIKKDGNDAAFSDIRAGMVISYAESDGSDNIIKTAVLSDNVIEGTTEQINTADRSITVDGTGYRASSGAIQDISIAAQGKFYLDSFGNIVYFDGARDIVYGYLYNIYADESGEDIYCRILTENNRWVSLALKSNVSLNGSRTTPVKLMDSIGSAPSECRQLIRYKVDKEGRIILVETASKITMGTEEDKQAITADEFRLSSAGTEYYRTTNHSFNGKIGIDSNARIFIVPDDKKNNSASTNDYYITNRDSLQLDTSYTYEAYDADIYRNSRVYVIKGYNQVINTSSTIGYMMLVSKLGGEMLTGEGEIRKTITGYWQGNEITLPIDLDAEKSPVKSYDELEAGDIIQITYNHSGNVDTIVKKFSKHCGFSLSTSSPYNSISFVSGKVLAMDNSGSSMVLEYNENGSAAIYSTKSINKVYIYHTEKNEFTVGTEADIIEGDTVAASARYLVFRELFVIRD